MQTVEILFLVPDNVNKDWFTEEVLDFVASHFYTVRWEERPDLTERGNGSSLPVRD